MKMEGFEFVKNKVIVNALKFNILKMKDPTQEDKAKTNDRNI